MRPPRRAWRLPGFSLESTAIPDTVCGLLVPARFLLCKEGRLAGIKD